MGSLKKINLFEMKNLVFTVDYSLPIDHFLLQKNPIGGCCKSKNIDAHFDNFPVPPDFVGKKMKVTGDLFGVDYPQHTIFDKEASEDLKNLHYGTVSLIELLAFFSEFSPQITQLVRQQSRHISIAATRNAWRSKSSPYFYHFPEIRTDYSLESYVLDLKGTSFLFGQYILGIYERQLL